MSRETFSKELRALINKESMDTEYKTPDFVLADYLMDCLSAFYVAAERRAIWRYSEPPERATDDPE